MALMSMINKVRHGRKGHGGRQQLWAAPARALRNGSSTSR